MSEMTNDAQELDAIVTGGSRAAVAGLVFAVLFVAGWILLRQSPRIGTSTTDFVTYYSDPHRRRASLIAGLYMVPFSAIAFIWFMAALRARYTASGLPENPLLSTVQLVAGALFVIALLMIGAIELALVWNAEAGTQVDVETARSLVALRTAMGQMVAVRAAAVFIAVSTSRAMRSGWFPRWYSILGFTIAVILMFAFTKWPATAMLMPLWVTVSSLLVLAKRRQLIGVHDA